MRSGRCSTRSGRNPEIGERNLSGFRTWSWTGKFLTTESTEGHRKIGVGPGNSLPRKARRGMEKGVNGVPAESAMARESGTRLEFVPCRSVLSVVNGLWKNSQPRTARRDTENEASCVAAGSAAGRPPCGRRRTGADAFSSWNSFRVDPCCPWLRLRMNIPKNSRSECCIRPDHSSAFHWEPRSWPTPRAVRNAATNCPSTPPRAFARSACSLEA